MSNYPIYLRILKGAVSPFYERTFPDRGATTDNHWFIENYTKLIQVRISKQVGIVRKLTVEGTSSDMQYWLHIPVPLLFHTGDEVVINCQRYVYGSGPGIRWSISGKLILKENGDPGKCAICLHGQNGKEYAIDSRTLYVDHPNNRGEVLWPMIKYMPDMIVYRLKVTGIDVVSSIYKPIQWKTLTRRTFVETTAADVLSGTWVEEKSQRQVDTVVVTKTHAQSDNTFVTLSATTPLDVPVKLPTSTKLRIKADVITGKQYGPVIYSIAGQADVYVR